MKNYNMELNALSCHKNKSCIVCGRKYPDTVLNIEGIIHHKCLPGCLDNKSCKKYKKKNKK